MQRANPQRPPYLFADMLPPEYARPVEPAGPVDRRNGPAPLRCDGQIVELTEDIDRWQEGMHGTRRRILDMVRNGLVVARVATYPEGPRCLSCVPGEYIADCRHVEALRLAGHLPEADADATPPGRQIGGDRG